jgi:hypothetical protein
MCSVEQIVEFYRRAEEARRMAKAALTPREKADLVEVEQRWMSLARNCNCKGPSEENASGELRTRPSNHARRRKR